MIGRAMIGLTFGVLGVALLGFIVAPAGSSPMFATPPDLLGIPAGVVTSLAGVAGVVVGLTWMIRIYRSDPEPDQHAWRYRQRRRPSSAGDRPSMTRGQRGREIGRGLIALAIYAIGLAAFLVITSPAGSSPMMGYGPRVGPVPVDALLLLVGITGIVGGLVWMIRIHRADPEPDQHAWRYRARDR
jgi:hypothetical protein